MKKQDIKDALDDSGKRCFINCFGQVWRNGGAITTEDIFKYDPEIKESAPGAISKQGLKARRAGIRKIFKNRRHLDALKLCFNAKIDPKLKAKAKRFYKYYYDYKLPRRPRSSAE